MIINLSVIRRYIRSFVPTNLRKKIYSTRKNITYNIKYIGTDRYCPACQRRSSRFKDFNLSHLHVDNGIIPSIIVPDTICPWCGSYVHHRLMWTILPEFLTDLTSRKAKQVARILHFAPEKFSVPRLEKLQNVTYITTDLMRNDVDVKFDMCKMSLAGNSFDLIVASHVLEHVPNDIDALNEIFRILKPGGYAVLLVPILATESYEQPDVVSGDDRLRLYGQRDHVRAYGLDLSNRISSCGFEVEVIRARDFAELNYKSYLLDIQGVLFLARKPLENES